MNKQNVSWKLVPVEPTEEMLKAMDECSTEGYDERLYAGHAASVYMAAVDVAPVLPQQCYCGDITRLGVVHRADSFCDEKPEQRPVAWMGAHDPTDLYHRKPPQADVVPLYTTPPQRKPLTDEQRIKIVKDNTVQGYHGDYFDAWGIIDDVEAAHGIKE